MYDLIPLEKYTDTYYYVLSIVLFFACASLFKHKLNAKLNLFNIQILIPILVFLCTLYMGSRPLSGRFFGDMVTYNQSFLKVQIEGISAVSDRDYLFNYFMYLCTLVMTNKMFFIVVDILYFLPIYIVSKQNFKNLAFYSIFLFVCSFSFWAYGTNGIRNGLATSVFLLVFATNKKIIQALILLIAVNLHSSMLIPTMALLVGYFYKNPKHILYGWFFCIPISLVAGGPIQSLFAGLIEDERTAYLTEGNVNGDEFSSTGFRWDFVLYSAAAIYAGWYYILKKKFNDERYRIIYSTYVVANAFWILVIKANFSNRFAYLSWFMMALVIIYPLLKARLVKNQYILIIYIMLGYFGFTFFMNVIK